MDFRSKYATQGKAICLPYIWFSKLSEVVLSSSFRIFLFSTDYFMNFHKIQQASRLALTVYGSVLSFAICKLLRKHLFLRFSLQINEISFQFQGILVELQLSTLNHWHKILCVIDNDCTCGIFQTIIPPAAVLILHPVCITVEHCEPPIFRTLN